MVVDSRDYEAPDHKDNGKVQLLEEDKASYDKSYMRLEARSEYLIEISLLSVVMWDTLAAAACTGVTAVEAYTGVEAVHTVVETHTEVAAEHTGVAAEHTGIEEACTEIAERHTAEVHIQ